MHATESEKPSSRSHVYTLTIQLILREWVPYLKPVEALVALFIADRTAGWGKQSEAVTHRHFLEGIRDRKTGAVCAGALPVSHPPLIAALRHLIELGAISATKRGRRISYSLNPNWNPYPESETMALPIPKRLLKLQTLQPTEQEESPAKGKDSLPLKGKDSLPIEGKGSLPYKKSKEKKGKIEEVNPSDSRAAGEGIPEPGELSRALSQARGRAVSRRKVKIARWSVISAKAAWQDLCCSSFPEARLNATEAHYFALKQYGDKWMGNNSAPVDKWLEYLGWVVQRWSLICSEHLGWCKSPPPPLIPSIQFFVPKADRFEAAWHSRASLEAKAGMTTHEREVAARVAKGMDKEVAEREVDSRLGITREREKMERAARELKRQREAADNDSLRRRDAAARNARWAEHAARTNNLDLSEGAFDPWA